MGDCINPDASTKRWALWLGATVASFAAMEAHAVSTRQQPTLTHALRFWMGVQPAKPWRVVASVLFVLFWTWMCGHTCLGWGPNLEGDMRPRGVPSKWLKVLPWYYVRTAGGSRAQELRDALRFEAAAGGHVVDDDTIPYERRWV